LADGIASKLRSKMESQRRIAWIPITF
jgi:hypothetical protein